MTEKTIKSAQQVIREFVDQAAKDPGVDKGSIEAIKTVIESEGKVSPNRLLRELERLRKK
jgi:hypothetical protein